MHLVLHNLLGHDLWATRTLLERCAALTEAQWNQEFEIGCGSLRKSLTHIVGAMIRWADRISEVEVRPSIEDDGKTCTPAELISLLVAASTRLAEIAADLERRGAWGHRIKFVDSEGGKVYHFTSAAAMTHVLTHGTHHRAQVLNIRRRLGLPALGLDLDVVEWEAVQTGQL